MISDRLPGLPGVLLSATALSLASATAFAQTCVPALTAEYEVVFQSDWSEQTHPDGFPPSPHFSGLLTASHHSGYRLWGEDTIASDGIEQMAETGGRSLLTTEVNDAITDGTAHELDLGDGIGLSPGVVTTAIALDQQHPLVSLVTMVAPSPDWFTGVADLDLFAGGNWVETVSIEAKPYDAGTDSGTDYTSSNQNTSPREPVYEITGAPFHNGAEVLPLGTITFTRLTATCVDSDGDDISDDLDNCRLAANPDQRDTNSDGIGNACDADIDNDCSIGFGDLAALKGAFIPNPYMDDADFNGDGFVNFGDLAFLKATFFNGATPGPGPGAPGNDCE